VSGAVDARLVRDTSRAVEMSHGNLSMRRCRSSDCAPFAAPER